MYSDPVTGRRNAVGRVVGRLLTARSFLTVDVPMYIIEVVMLVWTMYMFQLTIYQPLMANPMPFKSWSPYWRTILAHSASVFTTPVLWWVVYYDWAVVYTIAVLALGASWSAVFIGAIYAGIDWKNCAGTLWCPEVADYTIAGGIPLITYVFPATPWNASTAFMVNACIFFAMILGFPIMIGYSIYLRWMEVPRLVGEQAAVDAAVVGFQRTEGEEKKEFAQRTIIDIYGKKILLTDIIEDACNWGLVYLAFFGTWNIPRLNIYHPRMANPTRHFEPFASAISWYLSARIIPLLGWSLSFYRRAGLSLAFCIAVLCFTGWNIAMLIIQSIRLFSNCNGTLWCQKCVDYAVDAGTGAVTYFYNDAVNDPGKPSFTFLFNYVEHILCIVFSIGSGVAAFYNQYNYKARNTRLNDTSRGRSLIRSSVNAREDLIGAEQGMLLASGDSTAAQQQQPTTSSRKATSKGSSASRSGLAGYSARAM